MSQADSPTVTTSANASGFRDVFRAELGVVLPRLALPADTADEQTALASIATALDRPDTEDVAALCLSGGGIRSASFSLGVLQGLARFALLGRFHYLSSVSGGGYIGSWLSAWRSNEDDERVFAGLTSMQATGTEPSQIKGIRTFSNYLTPELGLFSADTWTAVAVYVRNLLLNWVLFLPFFTGCLLFPYWYSAALMWAGRSGGTLSAARWLGAGCGLLTLGLACAVCGRFRGQGSWLTRGRFLGLVLTPIVLSAMCFTVGALAGGIPKALGFPGDAVGKPHVAGAIAGAAIYALAWLIGRIGARRWDQRVLVPDLICWILAGAAVGFLISLGLQFIQGPLSDARPTAILGLSIGGLSGLGTLFLGPSTRTAATSPGVAQERLPLTRIASVAAVIFAASIAVLLSILGQRLVGALCVAQALCNGDREHDVAAQTWLDPLVMAALIVTSLLISLFVNVNRFSLHALYRNRLVRAYLGSARAPPQRAPDPFTGFDPHDNPNLATVEPRSGKNRLFHLINTTLNVVSTSNPAWQERKAESFAMTRQYCGNRYVGYRPTAVYGGKRGGITLGTAMAISGAALSPNHGYNSSPLVGFLLMLFNVRLGWWLGNPGCKFYGREGPFLSITPALKELAGATTDQGPWIYLSDGGHFDNLGLYEMVRRRCRCIVAIDAGYDPDMKFEDLADAVRKIYIDFGVSIDFGKLEFQARHDPPVAGARFAMATIFYPRSSPDAASPRTGWLLYIKPTYYGTTEGVDVRGYAADHPAFPHESTTDQWFSESQLEAYRALGAHIVEHICSGGSGVPPGKTPPALSLESLRAMLDKKK